MAQRRRGICVFGLLTLLVFFPPSPGAAQLGTVRGVVVDEDTGLSLPGVSVRIVAEGRSAVSNVEGRFLLLGVPTGTYEVVADYLGYAGPPAPVTVSEGSVSGVRLELRTEAVGLTGFTVVGRRRGQAAALNRQRTSPNITNMVASDQIGRFPDANIGDAMKRIPGVVVMQDQGEARFGLIRGTEPRLNSVMINGERAPSAEAEVRDFQLDIMPTDMVAAVEVNKALTADMDADAIGGAVNIVTRSAPVERRFSATVGSGYNYLAGQPMSLGSVLYADRLANDRLGMVVGASYFDHQLGSDNIEAEWNHEDGEVFLDDFQVRRYDLRRTRRSLSGGLDYRLSERNTFTWRSLYNHRDDWENRFRIRYKLEEPGEDGSQELEVRRETKGGLGGPRVDNARLEDQRVQTHSLSGEHLFGSGAALTWSAQFAQATEERPFERHIDWSAEDLVGRSVIDDTRKPHVMVAEAGADGLQGMELRELTEETQFTRDRDLNARVDLAFPFGTPGTEITVGARVRTKSKLRDNDYFEFEPMGDFGPTSTGSADYSRDSRAGAYPYGSFTTPEGLGGLPLEGGGFEGEAAPGEYLPGNFDADERILGAYAQLARPIGPNASLVAGLRVESTSIDYLGYEWVDDDESSRALQGEDSYVDVFPSLHLRYDLGNRRVLRLAWTNTIARPNYYDLVPYRIVVREDGEVETGNPNLRATRAMGLDAMFEQYFRGVGILSAGLFYKDITDFVFRYTRDAIDPVLDELVEITQPRNGGRAILAGFEVAVQRRLAGGLSVYGNYTLTHSSVDGLPIDGREAEELPLPGTSRHTANGSVSFDSERVSLRTSVNFQDDFIDPGEVGDEAFFDRYYNRALTVDFNGEIGLTPTARFFFEANNLTDQPLRYFQGVRERMMQEEFYGRRFQAGVKVDFR